MYVCMYLPGHLTELYRAEGEVSPWKNVDEGLRTR